MNNTPYYLDEDQMGSEWTKDDEIHGFAACLEWVTGLRVIVGIGSSDTEITEAEFSRALDLYTSYDIRDARKQGSQETT